MIVCEFSTVRVNHYAKTGSTVRDVTKRQSLKKWRFLSESEEIGIGVNF
jgi:hypothetical protein